jgi:hypothetical protein
LVGIGWAFIEPPTSLPVVIGLWTAWQVWTLQIVHIYVRRKPGDGGGWLVAGRFLGSFLVWGVLAALVTTAAYLVSPHSVT